jgi:tRNA threonylcarbamoyladenosine biosynthesis protein TsaB
MNLLLINTCAAESLVALATERGIVAEEALAARSTSEQMLPALRRLFDLAGIKAAELTAVVVVHGPGSFTGVRVGLSAAKGICDAAGCGLIAISRLALVASAAHEEDREVLALLDAGRSEFFAGAYAGRQKVFERLVNRAELGELLPGRFAVACEAAVSSAVGESAGLRFLAEPDARAILAEALRLMDAADWSQRATEAVASIDANYLRRTDAELLQERLAQKQ